jgi:hypothetical protein
MFAQAVIYVNIPYVVTFMLKRIVTEENSGKIYLEK